ncbi:ATP12 family chaperone protein [Tepidicaulis sp.]|uniref:ATP12 family chaperone protein n=1 Tax=Tepidicaulis sp. TaxID=1920809 RepID=UPI003B5B0B70
MSIDDELGRNLAADRFKPHPGKDAKAPKPKRFYKDVNIREEEGGFAITLDGRVVKTPAKAVLRVPAEPLGRAIAGEWDAQKEHIDTFSMPLTKLANTAIDRISAQRAAVIDEVMNFAGTDLLCYRADFPEALAERQAAQWQPLLDWAEESFGARLAITASVLPLEQDASHLARLRGPVEGMDDFELSGFSSLTALTGSLIIALAVHRGHITPETAYEAAHLDEAFQAEQWGEDAEARDRLVARRGAIEAAGRFLALMGR